MLVEFLEILKIFFLVNPIVFINNRKAYLRLFQDLISVYMYVIVNAAI